MKLSDFIGKTISDIESEGGPGDKHLEVTLHFDDGTHLELEEKGSEGSGFVLKTTEIVDVPTKQSIYL